MEINTIISIILGILTIISTLIGQYFSVKAKIQAEINGQINKVEDSKEDGKVKMQYVVNTIYDFVPLAYKGIFNKAVIEKLVQKAFDDIEKYAKKQINK